MGPSLSIFLHLKSGHFEKGKESSAGNLEKEELSTAFAVHPPITTLFTVITIFSVVSKDVDLTDDLEPREQIWWGEVWG